MSGRETKRSVSRAALRRLRRCHDDDPREQGFGDQVKHLHPRATRIAQAANVRFSFGPHLYYHRDTGTRLHGKPGSPEFVASYAEAGQKPIRSARSMRWINSCLPCFASVQQQSPALNPKRVPPNFDGNRSPVGRAPIAAMADPRFAGDALEWRDEIAASKPREADNRMIVFGRLLSWAKKRHRISANVLEGYERVYHTDRSDKIWLPEHIDAMHEVASTEFWPLFFGALFTGLRQGDLRQLPWSAYDGNSLTWQVTKRRKGDAGVKLTIPCTRALRALLDSLPRRGPLIFMTITGRAWQKRYVARHFDDARAKASKELPEIADLHFHDTRGTAITMLAEAGASVPEIAAITEHQYSILEKYLPRKVSTSDRHLAETAMSKLENSGRTDFANRLQTCACTNKKEEPK